MSGKPVVELATVGTQGEFRMGDVVGRDAGAAEGSMRVVEVQQTGEDIRIGDLIARSSVGAGLADIKARGIDAHLADEAPGQCSHPNIVPINADWARCTSCGDDTFPLRDSPADPDAPRKKRKKSTSPTARSLAELRKRGWPAGVVEKFVRFPPPGHHVDLFGVLDLIAIVTDDDGRGVGNVGIQACSGADHARRRDKILAEPRALQWVQANNRLELWSWSKRVVRKRDGSKAKRPSWTLRVETYQEMVMTAQDERQEVEPG